ncbi:MAG: glycosyltransferase, partial [Eubacterium sp.]
DFLVTGRPIIFYVPDFEKYKQERGLYFSVEDLPGPVSAELDEVAYWISNIDKYDTFFDAQKYTDAVKKYVYNDDGNACKRVVDAVFFGDESNTVSLKNNKKRLLFHTDALNTNGITFSLLNLLNNIDYEKYDVSLYAIEPKSGLSILDCVNPKARVLYRNSAAVANPKTEARREYCHENAIVASDNSPLFPKEFYELEYRRCFGDAQFDCIINFSGYNGFWANVYAANNSNAKNIIWMHSDLVSEFEKVVNGKRIHEKNLAQIFKIYDSVDKIVGCSNTTMLENRKNLATDKTYDKFTSAENLIDIDRIISGADKENIVKFNDTDFIFEACVNENGNTEYTLFPIPQKDKINFVTMGRLFPEKNHENLIKAFARINNEHPETALYIIGDGPLRAPLRRLIENLKLDKKVFLTGNMSNPFALLKRCSCFILPSYHEGLPMVLLEARTLGLPIIVSDFTTVADSIYENGQLVIGMEEEDIYNGLKAFINGEVLNEFKFDPKQYNNEAMAQFEMCL